MNRVALRWHDETDVADWLAFKATERQERHTPSPSEIESASGAIRDSWSPRERRKRAGGLPERVVAVLLDRSAIVEHIRSDGGWGEES